MKAVELWIRRRMLKILWVVKKANQEIMREAGAAKLMLNSIRKWQAPGFGHVVKLCNTILIACHAHLGTNFLPGNRHLGILDPSATLF